MKVETKSCEIRTYAGFFGDGPTDRWADGKEIDSEQDPSQLEAATGTGLVSGCRLRGRQLDLVLGKKNKEM